MDAADLSSPVEDAVVVEVDAADLSSPVEDAVVVDVVVVDLLLVVEDAVADLSSTKIRIRPGPLNSISQQQLSVPLLQRTFSRNSHHTHALIV